MTLKEFIAKHNSTVLDEELVKKVWDSNLAVQEKIKISLELNDSQPSYQTLNTMWVEYGMTGEATCKLDETIYEHYQLQLSNSEKDLSGTTEYSLYFDIFENPDRNEAAWGYFLDNSPSKKFLKIMLACSGPVPYDLKHNLYEELLTDTDFHPDIYVSIRHSCFDNCGQVDKAKARDIVFKLKLDNERDKSRDNWP